LHLPVFFDLALSSATRSTPNFIEINKITHMKTCTQI
jgi:hypothetical protein